MANGDGFSLGGMVAPPAQSDADTFKQNATAAMGPVMEFLQRRVNAQKEVEFQSQTEVETDKEGFAHVKIPIPYLNEMVGAAGKFKQIEGIYEKQIAEKQAQIDQAKRHPFANTLATIAGSVAAHDPNPYTRGLGEAALRLNPQPGQLEAEKNELLQGEAAIADKEIRSYSDLANFYTTYAREGREERKAQQAEADKARTAKLTFLRDTANQTGKGEFTPAGFAAGAELAGLSKKEIAELGPAFTEASANVAKAKSDLEDAKNRHADERQIRAINAAADRATASANSAMDRLNASFDRRDRLEKIKADAKGLPDMKKEMPLLKNLDAAERRLDDIDQIIKDYGFAMKGALGGPERFALKTLSPEMRKDLSEADTKLRGAVADFIKLYEAGTRGFSKNERGFFQSQAPEFANFRSTNEGISKAWRDKLREERAAHVDAYPSLKAATNRNLFGADADLIDQESVSEGERTSRIFPGRVPPELQTPEVSKEIAKAKDGNYSSAVINGKKWKIAVKGGRLVSAEPAN